MVKIRVGDVVQENGWVSGFSVSLEPAVAIPMDELTQAMRDPVQRSSVPETYRKNVHFTDVHMEEPTAEDPVDSTRFFAGRDSREFKMYGSIATFGVQGSDLNIAGRTNVRRRAEGLLGKLGHRVDED